MVQPTGRRNGSAQGAGLLLASQHLALAALVKPDDQFEVGPARCHCAGFLRPLLRLVDQRVVNFNAPLVALRWLEVVRRRASERGIPETLKCDHA